MTKSGMTMRPQLLFLAHRIPYPPNKGDKIRSYQILRHLAARFDIHLGCFVDDEKDWQYTNILDELCVSTHYVRLTPSLAKIKSLTGLLTGKPLSFPYYESRSMRAFVSRVMQQPLAGAFAFSSTMAPYIANAPGTVPQLVDLCDADSAKWADYAAGRSGLMRHIYTREAAKLSHAEQEIIEWADGCFAISAAEAHVLSSKPGAVKWFGNGVDINFFDPQASFSAMQPQAEVVFVGMMDYWANIDAAQWFVEQVWPRLRQAHPRVRLALVGANPVPAIEVLAQNDGVRVTGRVDDVRPWLAQADVVVAPLRIARGVQNKVLEAMAMGKPVVASPGAAEGIDAAHGGDLMVADGAEAFAGSVAMLLGDQFQRAKIGQRARQRIMEVYQWPVQLQRLDDAMASLATL